MGCQRGKECNARVTRHLAVDLGASGGKAFVGTWEGGSFRLEEIHRFSNQPVDIHGTVYWNVLSLYENILQVLIKARIQYGTIDSLAIDSWGVDFGLISENGQLLANPRHYRNMVTEPTMDDVCATLGRNWIFARSPTQFQPFNTLYQLVRFAHQEPDLWEQTATVLHIPSLLSYFLTGIASAEFTMATTTQMFSPQAGSWDAEILQRVGLSADILPPVQPAGSVLGNLTEAVQQQVGMDVQVILPPSHDTGAAVASIDMAGAETMFISTGTWCLAGMVLPEPLTDWKVIENNFANEGCLGGDYRLLFNGTGLWIVQQLLAEWRKNEPSLDYDELTALAAQAEPFVSVIDVNTPTLQQLGSMETTLRMIMNAPEADVTRGVLVRTALEGIALRMAWVRQTLEEMTGRMLHRVHMVGGGIRNELLCQFVANATQLPVDTGPTEATAVGNVLSQMHAMGSISSLQQGQQAAAAALGARSYQPQDRRAWEEAFGAFLTMVR